MKKYQYKPNIVEAEFFNSNIKPWPEGIVTNVRGHYILNGTGLPYPMDIDSHVWIVTDQRGLKQPYYQDEFNETFEEIKDVVED